MIQEKLIAILLCDQCHDKIAETDCYKRDGTKEEIMFCGKDCMSKYLSAKKSNRS